MTQGPGEFDLISKYFAPLAGPQGLGLLDDAAVFGIADGMELVVTADALVAGVHFRHTDPADLIARKSLRVNLSDLAAKGARPLYYLITIAWPRGTAETFVRDFTAGLALDQAEFGCLLLGGDTVVTPGPLSISITAFGEVPKGRMIRRAGAQLGDIVYVTGTIGDGAFGLDHPEIESLGQRYLLPRPRIAQGQTLRDWAHACMDISDGLLADAGHLAGTSDVAIRIDLDQIPLSAAARQLVDADPTLWGRVLNGGDDYELLVTARDRPPVDGFTAIGEVQAGSGIHLFQGGQKLDPAACGWDLGFGGWQHRLGA
jgi:thiamine-monophosphate kinase